MGQFLPYIGEVGFPILVTVFLLYRIETKLDAVIQSIESLPVRMGNNQTEKINITDVS